MLALLHVLIEEGSITEMAGAVVNMSPVISLNLINTLQKSHWSVNSKNGLELGNLSSTSIFFFFFFPKKGYERHLDVLNRVISNRNPWRLGHEFGVLPSACLTVPPIVCIPCTLSMTLYMLSFSIAGIFKVLSLKQL